MINIAWRRHLRFAIYLVALGIFFAWALNTAMAWDARLDWRLPEALLPLGALLGLAGAALAATCAGLFLSVGQGTPAPFDPPRAFVVRGPYRYVRNPMMIGALALFLGLALLFSSPSFLLFAAVLLILIHLFIVLWEEPDLERRFGEAYRQYKREVPRWIPRIPSR